MIYSCHMIKYKLYFSVAHELESHISSFASRVEQRRRLLELSVLFYSHTEEVRLSFWFLPMISTKRWLGDMIWLPGRFLIIFVCFWQLDNIETFHLQLAAWLTELRQELRSEEVADTLEGGERLIEQFSTQRDSTLDACASTIGEGKALLEELK